MATLESSAIHSVLVPLCYNFPMMKTVLVFVFSSLSLARPMGYEFSCQGKDGAQYYFFLKGQNSHITIESPRMKARKIMLSVPTSFKLEDGRILSSWSAYFPNAKTYRDRYSFATEVRTRYPRDGKETIAELTVFMDDVWLRDLECRTSGISALVKPPSETSLDAIDREILLPQLSRLDNSGGLVGEAFLRVESVLRRWVILEFGKDVARSATFRKEIAPALRYLHDNVIKDIRDRLPSSRQGNLDRMMVDVGQTALPEVERFLYWLKLGVETGNYPAIRSVIRVFLKSPLVREKDMRAYLQREGKGYWQKLAANDVKLISAELDPAEKQFFEGLWAEAVGKKTKAQELSVVERMAGEMNAAILGVSEKDKFGSDQLGLGRLQKRLTDFMQSPLYADKDARALYIRLVAPEARKLDMNSIKKISDWLTADEEGFWNELRK